MSAPLRIALVTPEHPECGPSFGVGAYVSALAGVLADAGHEVLLPVAGAGGWWTVAPGQAPRRWHDPGPAALRPALAAPWLRARLAAFVPDLVEYANWGGLGACDHGPWRRVVRLSTPVLEIPPADVLRAALRPLHHLWELRTVRRAHLLIANSAAMAATSVECYGREPHAVIPHAWCGAVLPPVMDGDEVLFVGRLEARKGVDVLLAAWQRIAAARPDRTGLRLHLVGPDAAGFGARALARWPTATVTVHGRLIGAELALLRRRCRIQVVPSLFESFGLVALEAWAGGQAVVASAAGGLAEVVGDAGLQVPPGDADALADALGTLLDHPARGAVLLARGQRLLRARYTPTAWRDATLAAYAAARARPAALRGWAGAPAAGV